jgi:hypothetical protein
MFDALPYLGRYLLGQSVRLSRSDKFPTKSRQKTKVIAAITRTLAVSTGFRGIKSRKILAFILSCAVRAV